MKAAVKSTDAQTMLEALEIMKEFVKIKGEKKANSATVTKIEGYNKDGTTGKKKG